MNSTTSATATLQLPQEYFTRVDMYPPQQIILSPGIKRVFGEQFIPREPTATCFSWNQAKEDATANLGDSFLVRKNEYTQRKSLTQRTSEEAWCKSAWEKGTYENIHFVIEYGITRVDLPARWRWDTICYLKDEESPYPFRHSRWTPMPFPF